MRETTSSSGAASSSGSLNGCTPSATPATSSNSRCNSAFGTVGTKETPSTSSRASTIAQPDFDIVVGSSSFLRLVGADCAIGVSLSERMPSLRPAGFVAALLAMTRVGLEVGQLFDRRDIGAVPGRAQHYFVHHQALRQGRDVENEVGAILGLHHAGLLLGADRVGALVEDRGRHLAGQEDAGADAVLA